MYHIFETFSLQCNSKFQLKDLNVQNSASMMLCLNHLQTMFVFIVVTIIVTSNTVTRYWFFSCFSETSSSLQCLSMLTNVTKRRCNPTEV